MAGRFVLLVAASALVVGACGLDGGPTGSPSSGDGASVQPSASPASPDSSAGPTVEPSDEPGVSAEPTVGPSAGPTAQSSGEPSPAPSGDGSGADPTACSGSVDNQDFFRAASEAIAWPVYCAVLPAGWVVDGGSFRLADGGQLQIAYRGPDGRRLELLQGGFCDAGEACVPTGTDLGPAAHGDREGTLIATGDESWAVVVDPGASIAWQALGSGMPEDEMRTLTSYLLRLAG